MVEVEAEVVTEAVVVVIETVSQFFSTICFHFFIGSSGTGLRLDDREQSRDSAPTGTGMGLIEVMWDDLRASVALVAPAAVLTLQALVFGDVVDVVAVSVGVGVVDSVALRLGGAAVEW